MALFEVTAYDKKIWEEELKDFLPEKILDVHTHVWLNEFVEPEKLAADADPRTVNWPNLVAAQNPFEDLQETYRLMFPGKDVKALMFTSKGGWDKNNAYVAKSARENPGWYGLYYADPAESAEQLEKNIREGGFLGVKSYLNRTPAYLPEPEVRIFDFFPKNHLEVLDRMGAIAMLHIPRHGRLKDPVNLAQITELKQEFPNVRLIIAHIGRAYTAYDVGDAFDTLDKLDLMYDFCANCCEYAITEVIRHAGPKKVMFGTDMPILRMRTHRIEENNTYINLIPPGMYGDPSMDSHLREVSEEEAEKITFFAYEELLAFKRAAKTLNLSKQDIEDIMYNNAMELIEGARKSIYGE